MTANALEQQLLGGGAQFLFLRVVFARAVEAAETDDEVVALCIAFNLMKRQVGQGESASSGSSAVGEGGVTA